MKVSIIVPVYNVEEFIYATLDSIIAQTMQDFEVLLIDDCSTDRSGEICKQIAVRDSRFKYIRNEKNSGPAPTRNKGIQQAQGEYLSFIDSDDVVEPQFLDRMVTTAMDNDADIVWCNLKYKRVALGIERNANHGHDGLIRDKDFVKCYVYNSTGCGSMCDKLYRKNFLKRNSLIIDEKIVNGEDFDFNLRASLCHPKVYAIQDVLYVYMRYGTISVSKTYFPNDFESYCNSYIALNQIAVNSQISEWINEVDYRFLCNYIFLINKIYRSNLSPLEKESEFKKIVKNPIFKKLLRRNVWNSKLTMRLKVNILAYRYGFNKLGKMFTMLPTLKR